MLFKEDDPNSYPSNKSSEPYVDRSQWFQRKNTVTVNGIEQIKVVFEHDYENGDYYEVLALEKVTEIPYNKTNEELQDLFREKETGFFSDPIYSQVDINDLETFLEAFIKDAERYGRDMSWYNKNNYALKFDSFDQFINENGYDPIYSSDLDFSSVNGGIAERGTIRISEKWWKEQPFLDNHNLHIQFLWELFARLLFTLDSICESGHILSRCGINHFGMVFSSPDEDKNFQKAAQKMFAGIKQKSWLSCSLGSTTMTKTPPPVPVLKRNSPQK